MGGPKRMPGRATKGQLRTPAAHAEVQRRVGAYAAQHARGEYLNYRAAEILAGPGPDETGAEPPPRPWSDWLAILRGERRWAS